MSALKHSQLSTIVGRFYEAAAEPDLWGTVLHEYAEAVGGDAAVLLPGPKARISPVCSAAFEEAVSTGLKEGWFAQNPRVTRGMRAMRGPRDIVTEERIFSYDEIDKQPWYADYAHRFGFGWFAGAYLVPDGDCSIMLSVERRRERGVFTRGEVDELSELVPHFQRAGQLAIRVAEARAAGMLDGLQSFSCAAALIDGLGRTVSLNQKAERLNGSLCLRPNRRVATSGRDADAALQKLIGGVLRAESTVGPISPDPVALPRLDRRPLIVHAAPVVGSARDIFRRARAILMIVDPDEHSDPAEPILKQAFRLTKAEIKVSLALLRGQEVNEIAQSSGVTEGTVRAQLKSIFVKTGTHRQAQLATLLSRLSGR